MAKTVIVTGGIGAGKSFISTMLRNMGYPVYDCDSRAKELMISDKKLRHSLVQAFGNDVYDSSGNIQREYLAGLVFENPENLKKLNAIVHPAVVDDVKRWAELHTASPLVFVETAIPEESGLRAVADAVIFVDASEDIRVSRVVARSGSAIEDVRKRIENQKNTVAHERDYVIVNDNDTALIPQIMRILAQL